MSALKPIFLRIRSEEIVFFKSVLESYDDLGIIRTLDQRRGEIVILALESTIFEVERLLASLAGSVEFERYEAAWTEDQLVGGE